MKKVVFTLLFLTAVISSFSQDDAKVSKQFFTEMGGPAVLFSANIDSRFSSKSNLGLGMRAGIGFTIKDEEIYDSNGFYSNDY